MITRRHVLQAITTLAAAGLCPRATSATPHEAGTMRLGLGTYGMKSAPIERAITQIADIGYDAVELTTWPGWDADPQNLSAARRQTIRTRLRDRRLSLAALMEKLEPSDHDRRHTATIEHLKASIELAHALSPDHPPLIQSTLGGGRWARRKRMIVDRVGDWLELARRHAIVLAIKPHRGGVMDRPGQAIWLIRQLGDSPHLRLVYDYSHYAFRDMPMDQTIRTALPYTAYIAVKDAVLQGDRVRFALPGEAGTVDYPAMLKQFHEGGYRGAVCCEVSGQVWNVDGYDPEAAARTCYANMGQAFEQAGISRT